MTGDTFLLMTQNPFVWRRRSTLRPHHPSVPHGPVEEWPTLRQVRRLLQSDYQIEDVRTFAPGGDQGVLFWVENRYVHRMMGGIVGVPRWKSLLERARLGRELVVSSLVDGDTSLWRLSLDGGAVLASTLTIETFPRRYTSWPRKPSRMCSDSPVSSPGGTWTTKYDPVRSGGSWSPSDDRCTEMPGDRCRPPLLNPEERAPSPSDRRRFAQRHRR